MTEQRRSFIVYTDWMEYFDDVSELELAQVLKAVFAYAAYGVEPEFTGAMRPIFRMMKNCIERDGVKYEAKCRRLSENARKGGLARAEKARNALHNEAEKKQMQPDSVNDNDNENVSESESVSDTDGCAVSASPAPALGKYGNVKLSEVERRHLCSEFGEQQVIRAVEEMSEYCASVGRDYRNWSAAIRRWIKRDRRAPDRMPAAPFCRSSDAPSYDLDEWMKRALSMPEIWSGGEDAPQPSAVPEL